MNLTIRCAAGNGDGLFRFPTIGKRLSDCYADGSVVPDRKKMVEALAKVPGNSVSFGMDDRDCVLAVGIDYMNAFHEFMRGLVSDGPTKASELHGQSAGAKNARAERKMKRGRVAFVRVHFSSRVSTQELVIRVSWANPMDIVGSSEADAHEVAVMCCQLAQRLASDYNSVVPTKPGDGRIRVVVEDHERCPGLLAEATADDSRRRLVARRKNCGHRRCDFCTADADGNPPDTSCPLFFNGKCREPGE